MPPLPMITLGDLLYNTYPRAIKDKTFSPYYSKLAKIKDSDWQCVFCQQVKDTNTCEAFITAYESRFGSLE
tara:strand:+ start:355 stop:567 length:213 start_codon:yes stop_codon:yes gene_type:complete